MIWSGGSQLIVVGVVCSRHGNTLDASMGSLLPSHNCDDEAEVKMDMGWVNTYTHVIMHLL